MSDTYTINRGRVKKNGVHYTTVGEITDEGAEQGFREGAARTGFVYWLVLADYVAAGQPDEFEWVSP